GRTGRAGRSGEAILFITPRERNLLKAIERATRQPISQLELPTVQVVNDVRIAKFKDQITDTLALGELEMFTSLIEDYEREHNVPAPEIAAALAKMARGNVPLLLDKKQREPQTSTSWSDEKPARTGKFERSERPERQERFDRPARSEHSERTERPAIQKKERSDRPADVGMQSFRIEVGHAHGVKPGNIVGAIANEAGLESRHIGRIDIQDDYSTLDLPADMPKELLDHLKSVWVAGQQLRISRAGDQPDNADHTAGKKTVFSPPKTGGNRRVDAKKAGDKPPYKSKSDFATRSTDATTLTVKPHRKGPKPA
ncbi:MAG: DbpA RNA binding domain-containing protein, partial [Oxalobacteraceae bacterium]